MPVNKRIGDKKYQAASRDLDKGVAAHMKKSGELSYQAAFSEYIRTAAGKRVNDKYINARSSRAKLNRQRK